MATRIRRLSATARPRPPPASRPSPSSHSHALLQATLQQSAAHASTCPPSLLELISSSSVPTSPQQQAQYAAKAAAEGASSSYIERYRNPDGAVSRSFGPTSQQGQALPDPAPALRVQRWHNGAVVQSLPHDGPQPAGGIPLRKPHQTLRHDYAPPPPPSPATPVRKRARSPAPPSPVAAAPVAATSGRVITATSPLAGAGATTAIPPLAPTVTGSTAVQQTSHAFSTSTTASYQSAPDVSMSNQSPPTGAPSSGDPLIDSRRAAARQERHRMEELWGASNGEARSATATGPGSSFGDRPKPKLRLRPTFNSGPERAAGALSFIPHARRNGNGLHEAVPTAAPAQAEVAKQTASSAHSPSPNARTISSEHNAPTAVPRRRGVPFPYPPVSHQSTSFNGHRVRPEAHSAQSVVDRAVQAPPLTREEVQARRETTKVAMLFPGSGCQYVGMGGWMLDKYPEAREVWEEVEEALVGFEEWRCTLGIEEALSSELGVHIDLANSLGAPATSHGITNAGLRTLREVVFGGPQAALTLSTNAQPAILITSLCLARVLGPEAIARTDVLAGHSSGEYSAAVVAGALTVREAVRLTRLHGLLTSRTLRLEGLRSYVDTESPPEQRAQMSAVVINPGKTFADVDLMVDKVREEDGVFVEVASYNSASQIVLSGTRAGVLEACEALTEAGIGARAADLPCAAPFHSTLMAPAAAGMRVALSSIPHRPLTRPIVSGLTALPIVHPPDLTTHLTDLIAAPVRWSSAIETMVGMGVRKAVFVGPGRALANLAKRQAAAVGRKVRFAGDGERAESGKFEEEEDLEMGSVATEEDFERVREMLQD